MRLDLLILAEGYTADQEEVFLDDAEAVLTYLRSVEPYASHADWFNVWAAFDASAEAGADADEGQDSRDTHYGCFYGCGGLDRLICCDDEAVGEGIATHAPFADGVLVLVGERTVYGGSGGETYAVSYTGGEGLRVALHEVSHSLIGLWDEYGYGIEGAAGDFVAPNCHPESELPPAWEAWVDGDVDWASWPGDPAAACEAGLGTTADRPCAWPVCSFTNWVRPTRSSCAMHTLQDHFCPVCQQAILTEMVRELGGVQISDASPAPLSTVDLSRKEAPDLLGVGERPLRAPRGRVDRRRRGGRPRRHLHARGL